MTPDEKLAAILAAVQVDPGNRGLAELFTFCPGDFVAACQSIAGQADVGISIDTGFYIPTGTPPAFETDGPLGAAFLFRAFTDCLPDASVTIWGSIACIDALQPGVAAVCAYFDRSTDAGEGVFAAGRIHNGRAAARDSTHAISVEVVGKASDARYYTMRGRDITEHAWQIDENYMLNLEARLHCTIGIGDGGNEIGMGKIPHDLIAKNIPNGDLIHCRVPTDHLIVAGVSNWGAYALAAGVYVLRGATPPADLFDPDRERAILEVMVREGPLVDGVTGKPTATVDGLTWDEYVRPLVHIREILEA